MWAAGNAAPAPKEKILDPASGRLCGHKVIRYCTIADVKEFCNKHNKDCDATKGNYQGLFEAGTQDDLVGVYSRDPKGFQDNFMCNGYLPVVWVKVQFYDMLLCTVP